MALASRVSGHGADKVRRCPLLCAAGDLFPGPVSGERKQVSCRNVQPRAGLRELGARQDETPGATGGQEKGTPARLIDLPSAAASDGSAWGRTSTHTVLASRVVRVTRRGDLTIGRLAGCVRSSEEQNGEGTRRSGRCVPLLPEVVSGRPS